MFTEAERRRLRASLLQHATGDIRVSGAAVTGSGADEREDIWSDIDLAFGIRGAAAIPEVLADWTAHMYAEHGAVHHIDIHAGAWTYRVFLLASTLQVDLAFVDAAEFCALGNAFQLVQGEAMPPRHAPSPEPSHIIGMAWLYALHARSSIERGKLWQAEYMISGIRDHAIALACLRHRLPADHARGMDQLPESVKAMFLDALVQRLEEAELRRAFRVVMKGLAGEIRCVDEQLAGRLQTTLERLSAGLPHEP